jgi:hypothetical protein
LCCAASFRKYATDVVALAPDVIATTGAAPMVPLLQATHTKQIAPGVTRAAVLRDPNIPNGIGHIPTDNATDWIMIMAMCRMRSRCCALAASGQAAAPPRSVMNSRRFIQ